MNAVHLKNPTSSFWTNLFKKQTVQEDIIEILRTIPMFENLSSKYLKMLPKIVHNRVYEENETIFFKGDPGIGFYIIRDGEVNVTQPNIEGEEIVVANLTRGDFFGEVALLDDQRRSATAKAAKPSNLTVIFKPDLDDFMDRFPKAGVAILRNISLVITTRLKRLNEDYIALMDSQLKE